MTGYATIQKIRDFERRAANLGLAIQEPTKAGFQYSATSSTYSSVWINEVSNDNICLVPVEDRYPSWGSRRTPIFTGTIEEANIFLQGIDFAYISDAGIGLTSREKRLKTEAKVVERMRKKEEERKKKEEQRQIWSILKDNEDDEEEDWM